MAAYTPNATWNNGAAPGISAEALNHLETQYSAALTMALPLTGGTMSGAIAMGNFKITGLGTPTVSGDATTKAYADLMLPLTGGTMAGAIAMGNNKITGLGTPTVSTDAATKAYADLMLPLAGGTLTPGGLTISGNLGQFTTAGWYKQLALGGSGTLFWPMGAASRAIAIGRAGDNILYFMASTADSGTAAVSYPMTLDVENNILEVGSNTVLHDGSKLSTPTGSGTVTVTITGVYTVTHSLGRIPVVMIAPGYQSNGFMAYLASVTTAIFTISYSTSEEIENVNYWYW